MTYPNYPSDVVKDMLKNTRKYAGDPHALLIAYVLSSIKELLDEDEDLWGAKVPTEILDRYIDSCYDDFMKTARKNLLYRHRRRCQCIPHTEPAFRRLRAPPAQIACGRCSEGYAHEDKNITLTSPPKESLLRFNNIH